MLRKKKVIHRLLCLVSVFFLALLMATSGCAREPDRLKVRAVIDGDTVDLSDGRRVRLIGINAPEAARKDRQAQVFSREATEFLKNTTKGQAVLLETGNDKADRYGRTLAYVFLEDGSLVNEALLEQGLAWYLYKNNKEKYEKRLLAAQRRAMEQGRGIWEQLGWYAGPFVGNRNTMRFHRPDCPNSKQIAGKNRVGLSEAQDAFYQGYAPGSRCLASWPD